MGCLRIRPFSRASLIGKTYETSKLGIWQFKLPRGDAKVRAKSIKDIIKNGLIRTYIQIIKIGD